mgnify:CR=1 FL=1
MLSNFKIPQHNIAREFGTSGANVSRWLSGRVRMPIEFARYLEGRTGVHWSEILEAAHERWRKRKLRTNGQLTMDN